MPNFFWHEYQVHNLTLKTFMLLKTIWLGAQSGCTGEAQIMLQYWIFLMFQVMDALVHPLLLLRCVNRVHGEVFRETMILGWG